MPLAVAPNPNSQTTVALRCSKGHGDSASWASILLLHQRRGFTYPIRFSYGWAASRYFVDVPGPETKMAIIHHPVVNDIARYWEYNEIAANVSGRSLRDIGTPRSLWKELCDARPEAPDRTAGEIEEAERAIAGIEGPMIYCQLQGWSYMAEKSVPPAAIPEYATRIADATGATVLLDNHYANMPGRGIVVDHPKVKLVSGISIPAKFEIWTRCALLVGIDSSMLHIGRMAWHVPSIGLWMSRRQRPERYTLPTPNRINLVPSGYHDWNCQLGEEWNIHECGYWSIPPEAVAAKAAEICLRR